MMDQHLEERRRQALAEASKHLGVELPRYDMASVMRQLRADQKRRVAALAAHLGNRPQEA